MRFRLNATPDVFVTSCKGIPKAMGPKPLGDSRHSLRFCMLWSWNRLGCAASTACYKTSKALTATRTVSSVRFMMSSNPEPCGKAEALGAQDRIANVPEKLRATAFSLWICRKLGRLRLPKQARSFPLACRMKQGKNAPTIGAHMMRKPMVGPEHYFRRLLEVRIPKGRCVQDPTAQSSAWRPELPFSALGREAPACVINFVLATDIPAGAPCVSKSQLGAIPGLDRFDHEVVRHRRRGMHDLRPNSTSPPAS